MTNNAENQPAESQKLRALVFGGSGAVGSILIEQLLADDLYSGVHSAGRRALELSNTQLEQHVVDMTDTESFASLFIGIDQVFCCLGTTIKTAGSKQKFRQVDYELPVALGKQAKAAGVSRFVVVSAMGASSSSKVFYNRVKGEMQHDLAALDLPALDIVQPSLLLGSRDESRPGETLGKVFMPLLKPLLQGSLKHYRGIHPKDVAAAMIAVVNEPADGCRIHKLGDYA